VSEREQPRLGPAASPADALRRLIGRGSVYTLGLAVQMLAAFIVIPVLTRLLTPSAYGRVAAGLVVFTLLAIIAGAGLPDAAQRTFFGGRDGPSDARRLTLAVVVIACVISLILDLTGALWAPLFGLHYTGVLRLAVWGGAAGAVTFGAQAVLRAEERAWAFLAITVLGTIGGQSLGLALTAALHSPTAYMAGLVAGTALAAVTGLAITSAYRAGLPRLSHVREGLALGLPIVPHGLSVYLLASADRIVIAAILGLAATGRYQVAYGVGGLGVALITALNQAWLPIVLGAPGHNRWEILTATSRVVGLIAAFVASTLALLAPLGLLIAAPPSYGRAALVPVAAIVAFSALPYATSSIYFQIVFVLGRTRVMAAAAPAAAAVNIAINVALLPIIGLVGAAIATVAAYAVLPAIVALRARRLVSLPQAERDSLGAWVLAAPFVVAGALLPWGTLGAGLRVTGVLAAAVGGYRLIGAAMRNSSTVAEVQPAPDAEPPISTGRLRPTVEASP
jgi:O-antigen/teichoic acid export membrane protein